MYIKRTNTAATANPLASTTVGDKPASQLHSLSATKQHTPFTGQPGQLTNQPKIPGRKGTHPDQAIFHPVSEPSKSAFSANIAT